MNLLVDRIEHPGRRRKTSLKFPDETPKGGQTNRRYSTRESEGVRDSFSTEDHEKNQRVNLNIGKMNVPSISVNDKPVLGHTEAKEKKPSESAFHRAFYHTGPHQPDNYDYTKASAGMFSDCIFGYGGHKRTVVPKPKGSDSSSSSSSILTYKSQATNYKPEQLKRMPTANTDNIPQLTSNLQLDLNNHRFALHQKNSKILHKRKGDSFPYASDNDNKRLVNQFLRSIEVTPNVSALHLNKTSMNTPEVSMGDNLPTNGSLQNLLYCDLDTLRRTQKRHVTRSPYAHNKSVSSSDTSLKYGLYNQGGSLSSSVSFPSSESSGPLQDIKDSVSMKRNGSVSNGMALNYNEIDYYRRHIGSELNKFEEILKSNLKHVIMRNEHDMEKNLAKFDSLTQELSKLKDQANRLHDQILTKDLVELRNDFDRNDDKSFINVITNSICSNAEQLEKLETRINVCRQKLFQQRDTLRKLEGLLTLEDSLLDSKKTSHVAYRYRYIIFDFAAVVGIIAFFVFIRWIFMRKN